MVASGSHYIYLPINAPPDLPSGRPFSLPTLVSQTAGAEDGQDEDDEVPHGEPAGGAGGVGGGAGGQTENTIRLGLTD